MLPFDYAHGAHRSHSNAPTVRPYRRSTCVCVFPPLSHLPPAPLPPPHRDCFSSSFFSTSEFFFAFGASGQPADKPSVGPVTLAVSCRARALNPRSYFRRVRVCECVAARPPLLLLYSSVCVCVILSCAGFSLSTPMRKDQEKIISLKIEKHRNSTRNRLISPRLVPRRHLTVSPFQNCQKNNNNNF